MKPLQSQQRINSLLSLFVTQVKGATALGQYDINHIAETILIPLFREVWGYKKLKNLNAEQANFPSVDLGDNEARVAIQVTSAPDSEKVKETLRKFVRHKLYYQFDRVIIYILTEKQASYSGSGYDEILDGHLEFDKEQDICDYRDILRTVDTMQLGQLQRVEAILEANFGNGSTLVLEQVPEHKTEAVFLNLLEISFPDTLYIADLSPDLKKTASLREQDPQRRHPFQRRRPKHSPGPRERVREFLQDHDLKFAVDWEYHAGQIVTFHNLEDDRLPLAQAIERGTVTPLSPEEFYGAGDVEENVFRSLLRRCLQQKLYARGIQWQHQAHLFIFGPEEGEELRKEEWVGKKKNPPREVYKIVKKDPAKIKKRKERGGDVDGQLILYHKHLAFETQFFRFGNQWRLLIQPNWYFSFDGYKPSFYGAKNLAWLKKNEGNSHVFNQLRFIVYFIKTDSPSTLFKQPSPYEFLSFGELLALEGSPELDDRDWLPGERESKRKNMSDPNADSASLFDKYTSYKLLKGDMKVEDEEEIEDE